MLAGLPWGVGVRGTKFSLSFTLCICGPVTNWLVEKAVRMGCDFEMLWKREDLGEADLFS